MRKFSATRQTPFTPSPSMESTTQAKVTLSASTSSNKNGSKLFSGLKGMLRRRRTESLNEDVPPPLPVDAASTIKRARRQTYVLHSATSELPKPLPVLTLSSHHLVVRESDRRDLAARVTHHYSYLTPIPEYGARGGESFTSSSSIASCSSSSTLSSVRSTDQVDHSLGSPQSRWSDDSSDEYDCACQCTDLTFTNSSRLCSACAAQDVPEDEGSIESDVDSLLDSYLDGDGDESDYYARERWSIGSSSFSSSSASSLIRYDPLFSPRSSSTTFTVASPRGEHPQQQLCKSRCETPVDIRDFDMILTSSPPSPHGIRFHRSSIDAREALIAESRIKRVSNGTI